MAPMQTIQAKQAQQRKAAQDDAARQVALRAPSKKLALQLLSKGWRIGRPQMSVGDCPCLSPAMLYCCF